MNRLKPMWGVLCLFPFVQSYAAGPLWTFTPITPTTLTVNATDLATVEYIVQNQSAKPTRLKMLPVNGITQLSDCILAPRGQPGDQCTLNLSINGAHIAPAGVHGGPNVCQTNNDGTPNINQCYRPTANYVLNITRSDTPTPPPPTQRPLVAVGVAGPSSQNNAATIFSSNDNGATWTTASFSVSPALGSLLGGVFCLPNTSHCVAVGYDYGLDQPVHYISNDAGQNWDVGIPISGGSDHKLISVSCNTNNQCVSVGYNSSTPMAAIAYRSTDGGVNWLASSPPGLAFNETLFSVSCTLKGSLCVAVGYYEDSTNQPLAYTSSNNGNSWANVTLLPPEPTDTRLQGVFCNETGSRCIAVGRYDDPNGRTLPVAYVFTNNGMSAISSVAFPTPTVSASTYLNAVSCDTSGIHCIAVGYYEDTNPFPVSYVSNDGGSTWALSTNLPAPQGDPVARSNELRGITCNENASDCTAVGGYQDTNNQGFATSYTSTDGGNNWVLSSPFPSSTLFALLTGVS